MDIAFQSKFEDAKDYIKLSNDGQWVDGRIYVGVPFRVEFAVDVAKEYTGCPIHFDKLCSKVWETSLAVISRDLPRPIPVDG